MPYLRLINSEHVQPGLLSAWWRTTSPQFIQAPCVLNSEFLNALFKSPTSIFVQRAEFSAFVVPTQFYRCLDARTLFTALLPCLAMRVARMPELSSASTKWGWTSKELRASARSASFSKERSIKSLKADYGGIQAKDFICFSSVSVQICADNQNTSSVHMKLHP